MCHSVTLDKLLASVNLGLAMVVKQHNHNGRLRWVADGRINGQRKRRYFDTKAQADSWKKLQHKDTTSSVWWLGLSNGDRVDMMNAYELSRKEGFSLVDAVHAHAVFGRGVTHLKKMTLSEAVGHTGTDNRFKDKENQEKQSGFLGVKKTVGVAKQSLSTMSCVLRNFRDYCGGQMQCRLIMPELIMKWVMEGGHLGKKWESVTRDTYVRVLKNFCNWLVRQDVIKENPVLKLEAFKVDPFDPYVLTPEECRKVLILCREKHFDVLPLLSLNLFCGIRPSETKRLRTSANRRDSNFDWDDKEVRFAAKNTKTKMPRIVSMSDNCITWLNCHTQLQMPITNANHKWNKFLQDARKELGYDLWPHDCLRHSFCSYLLRKCEDLGVVALQAGHTERVSLKHYLKQVSKAEAKEFWNIFPEKLAA